MKAYLFLSADLVNSTGLKTAKTTWTALFSSFYRSFPKRLNASIDEQNSRFKKTHKAANLKHPIVWKLVGDEILFYLEVSGFYERVLFTIAAFKKAIVAHNNDDEAYKIRGTVWFANVDRKHRNQKICPSVQGHPLFDFLGSDVDTGFRLCKYSSPEKLIISAETAILLIRDNYLTIEEIGLRVCFDGTTRLRGVDSDTPSYPLIWIDLLSEVKADKLGSPTARSGPQIAAEMRSVLREIQTSCPDRILRYCQLYLKSIKGKLVYPCIPRDKHFGC